MFRFRVYGDFTFSREQQACNYWHRASCIRCSFPPQAALKIGMLGASILTNTILGAPCYYCYYWFYCYFIGFMIIIAIV